MSQSDRTPKKIAGLKLPKEIREAPAIKALLSTEEGRKLFADALIEGAAAAAAKVIAAHESKAKEPASKSVAKKPARIKTPVPVPAPALATAPAKSPADKPSRLESDTPTTAEPAIELLGTQNNDNNGRPSKSGAAD